MLFYSIKIQDDKISVKENKQLIIDEEMEKDRVFFPIEKYNYMLVTYIFLVLFTVIKGSEHSKSIIGVLPYIKFFNQSNRLTYNII